MATAPYRARYDRPPPPAVLKGQACDRTLTFKSLLTYPVRDLAGDFVDPAGCDFTLHQLDPAVDLEHGRDPTARARPVCWARDSLDQPGGRYAVEMVRLNFAEHGHPDDWHTVPVGTEYYKADDRLSVQVFALREQGALPASSLEFEPVPGHFRAIGWSELEGRAAYHFDRVRVRRWTVCARGINPGALTLTKSAAPARQVPPALDKILRDGRVNVGGTFEPLCPAVRKALAAAAPGRAAGRPVTAGWNPDPTDPSEGTMNEDDYGAADDTDTNDGTGDDTNDQTNGGGPPRPRTAWPPSTAPHRP